MVFSSPIFLFGFLPLVLSIYFISPRKARNPILLLASLIFYAWGEGFYVLLLLVSILLNYFFGLLVGPGKQGRTLDPGNRRRVILGLGVAANLLLLGANKYANFIANNLNDFIALLGGQPMILAPVHLPLGISFFTFQALSYLIDVYRGTSPVQRNLLNLGLYIALFPQLIAGPIVRYCHIMGQITQRRSSPHLMASGIERFVFGLSKKTLIADPLGLVADKIFYLPVTELTTGSAWLGLVCYTFQIYFDFSGYSDMAIGLGRMFGFRIRENFNYPYIARSIQEFWRRWHISLSTWFRDYLYIPMGGNRVAQWRLYMNLIIVFTLCGLWHGASWTFLFWGLWHGLFMVIERQGLGNFLNKIWPPYSHVYTLFVIMVGWVFFKTEDLSIAAHFLATMAGMVEPLPNLLSPGPYWTNETILALMAAALFSMPVYPRLLNWLDRWRGWGRKPEWAALTIVVSALFCASLLKVSANTYSPFIYFRF